MKIGNIKIVSILLVMFMSLLLAGCIESASEDGSPKDSPENTSSENTSDDNSSNDGNTNNTSGGASADTGKTFNWKMISVWGASNPAHDAEQAFVDKIQTLSNGRLNIELHAAGELAAAGEVHDLVSKGTVQMGGDWPNYWGGSNSAYDLLGAHVVGFTNWDYLMWIYEAGGLDMYQEIYGQDNLTYYPLQIYGMESGIRSKEPIQSLEDFKGKKIRTFGVVPNGILQELGATPVALPPAEVYESLQRGLINAVDQSTPSTDESLALQEVAPHWTPPGWTQTGSISGVMINKEAWNSLPGNLQEVVKIASESTVTEYTAKLSYNDAKSTNRWIDEYGVEIHQLTKEELERIADIAKDIYAEEAEKNPDFKKVLLNQQKYLDTFEQFRSMQGPYGFGSNIDTIDIED